MKLGRWRQFPIHIKNHLNERLKDRQITLDHLDALRVWVESSPEVPDGEWFKNFGDFKICGRGTEPSTFLTREQEAWGHEIDAEADEAEA